MSLLYRATAHLALAATLALHLAAPAAAHQAHTHGRIELDVAVEPGRITLRMESPLHDLLGFERAPRSVAERGRVTALDERLRAADRLFVADPAGECTLAQAAVDAPVLGLGAPAAAATAASAASAPADPKADPKAESHADLVLTATFDCRKAEGARFIDVKLFDAFPGVRTVAAQVAGPKGQGLTLLRKSAARLPLSK